ncbi:MAG: hypothetical protein AB8B61_00560 [Cyclobacteriaceae bacterium]
MMDQKTWMKQVVGGLEMFANPHEEFTDYEFQNMIRFYKNYFLYAYTFLFDMGVFDYFIKNKIRDFKIEDEVSGKLKLLRDKIEDFHEYCYEFDDFTLIRCKEWEEIIPLAKECMEALKKDIEMMKD